MKVRRIGCHESSQLQGVVTHGFRADARISEMRVDGGGGDAEGSADGSKGYVAAVVKLPRSAELVLGLMVGQPPRWPRARVAAKPACEAEPVLQTVRQSGRQMMVLTSTAKGSVLNSTYWHPIWDATQYAFIGAGQLHGPRQDRNCRRSQTAITRLNSYSANVTARTLQVSTVHTYSTGTTPVLVHNSCGPDYQPRVRARGLQDPSAHNFPYSYDETILKSTPTAQGDGSLLYQVPGVMNGKDGVYEIALNPDTNTIFHRFFRPYK